MKTVLIDVEPLSETLSRAVAAMETQIPANNAHISFATQELMWKVLTAKRWEILKVLCGTGEIPIREVARRVKRDIKAVHTDCHALIKAGIINRTQSGGVHFPYDKIKVEFEVQAA